MYVGFDARRQAGARISDDLSPAGLIIGVKEVPIAELLPERWVCLELQPRFLTDGAPDRSYMFFSHTIKAQPYNMAMLDSILSKVPVRLEAPVARSASHGRHLDAEHPSH